MNITILFDSTAINPQFKTGWGFSCLINHNLLFDTGENGEALLNNIKQTRTPLSKIQQIVISHEHYDHIDGLWEILKNKPNTPVYICPNLPFELKNKIKKLKGPPIETQPFQAIDKNIFTTGEMNGIYKNANMPEQSIILKTLKGLVIITGCAHAKITDIITTTKTKFPNDHIYLVLGGFHLRATPETEIDAIAKLTKALEVEKIAPLHCSGDQTKEIFKKYYSDDLIDLKVGETLEI